MKITRVVFRFCPILLVVFVLTMPGVTMAQIDPESQPDSGLNEREESTPEQYPVLNGHRFFPTILIGSPFVQSTISSAIGGGRVGDLNYTITNPVNDSTLSLRGDLGFLLVLLEFQHALDEFVAIQFKTIIIERIATHEESLLSQGLTGEVGFELGIRVKIWETDRVPFLASNRQSQKPPLRYLKTWPSIWRVSQDEHRDDGQSRLRFARPREPREPR